MSRDMIYSLAVALSAGATVYALISAFARDRRERCGLEGLPTRTRAAMALPEADRSYGKAIVRPDTIWSRSGLYRTLDRLLERAGWNLTPLEFLSAMLALALVAGIAAGVFGRSAGWAMLGVAAVGAVPPVGLVIARIHRMARFEAVLPEALDLMAASLRSGQGFQRALHVTAEDMPSPVKEEFSLAVQDIIVGRTVEEALRGILKRVPSYEMELITTAVSVQMQVGGNLSEILQKIADTLRERARIRGEIATLTAEGKLSAGMVFIIPFVLFFWLQRVNPTYMAPLMQTDPGRAMLLGAAISACAGMLIIWKMVSMEV